LGWGDVGFHYDRTAGAPPEIQTPTMDGLARQGLVLNRHYVHSTCTGTRVALQSGRLPVHVQTSLKNPEDPSSGMPRNMTGLAEHLKKANYSTHYVGKWDVGMATPKHTPQGRGYDSSLHYFEHKNDYWTQQCVQSTCCPHYGGKSVDSEWEGPMPDTFYNLTLTDLWDTNQPARHLNGTDYEEFIFLRRMKEIIRNHNASGPLFLFYAPHVAHCPLQVPQEYLDKFHFITNDSQYCQVQTPNILPSDQKQPTYSCRKQYRAMVHLLDDILQQLVQAFQRHDLWKDTLLVFTSDNGGPLFVEESGSTNFDLRGGKYTDWEGGVRATAFVAGGYLPQGGRVVEEIIHIADWYVTLPALAGVDAVSEEDSNLPPVDAVNVWPLFEGTIKKSPRQEIPLSTHALLQGDYKLLWKDEVEYATWSGPYYPSSAEKPNSMVTLNCSQGCLYNVAKDRGEHFNLAKKQAVRLQSMKHRLIHLRKEYYENDDVGVDSCPPDIDMPCACWMAMNYYGGFLGPFQEVNF
jgi:arylsulfatase I/J